MFNVALVKSIVSIAAGSSAGYVARQIITNNVTPQTSFEIARTWLGSVAIGGAVGGYIQKDTHNTLDQIEDIYKQIQERRNTAE